MVKSQMKHLRPLVLGIGLLSAMPGMSSEVEHYIGLQLGVAKPTATSEWSVDPLTTGIDSDYGFQPGVVLAAIHHDDEHVWRYSAGLMRGKWSNACILELAFGVDYLLSVRNWQAYVGPRAGVLRFENDHTESSARSYLAGLQLGVLISPSALPNALEAIGGPTLELYGRRVRTNATADRQVGGQTHQVNLERIDALGVSLNWRF